MKITLEIDGSTTREERGAELHLPRHELATVHLHLAFPEQRDRTGLYMRRHGPAADPNHPFRSEQEPSKLPIAEHLEQMFQAGTLHRLTPPAEKCPEPFRVEPARFVVPVSDLAANLLRP